jgi:hypothetical protein
VREGARKQGREVGEISIRSASWLAWSLCALSLALTARSFFVIALNLSLDAPVYFYWLEPTTIAIGYSVIGAIIASRLPDHRMDLLRHRLYGSGRTLQQRVRHLCSGDASRGACGRQGDALALYLGLDRDVRAYRVLDSSIPQRSVAQQ